MKKKIIQSLTTVIPPSYVHDIHPDISIYMHLTFKFEFS